MAISDVIGPASLTPPAGAVARALGFVAGGLHQGIGWLGALSSTCCLVVSLFSAAAAASPPVDYVEDVKPILAQKCFACHGALKQEGGLRLDAASLIRAGGDSGPALVAGQVDASLLIERVAAEDEDARMPPAGEAEPLTGRQLAIIKTWIEQGAVAPDDPVPADPREHWAYQALTRPALPRLREAGWAANPVDLFLAAEHEARGLTHVQDAEPQTLLRRVYYDLIGLPPTRGELLQFLRDNETQANAYERVVDRLLDSPQYGERWGRHWMDVWRYSDWTGFRAEIRYSQRHIWRWRDWIVESLNADQGYDQMILEMLAADELAPGDSGALRATGFLARNWYKFDRNSWLDDTVEHTGKAFLGLTIKCARCHDHKYDPISQREYYELRAVFEPYDVRTDRIPGSVDINTDGLARVYDARPDAVTYLFQRGDPKRPETDQALLPGVPAVMGGIRYEPRTTELSLTSYYPALRDFVVRDMIDRARAAVEMAATELAQRRNALAADGANRRAASSSSGAEAVALAERKLASAKAELAALQARIAAERARYVDERAVSVTPLENAAAQRDRIAGLGVAAAQAERKAVLAAAEERLLAATAEVRRCQSAAQDGAAQTQQALAAANQELAAAQQAVQQAREAVSKNEGAHSPLGPTYPAISTGRRLALARWITDSSNPLTARVAINHIWLRHFGRPLVENMDDFGLRSPRPALARVLDYLAVELVEHGWSMKHIHRLLVTSRAYRMSSRGGDAHAGSVRQDLDNQFFWRMNSRRMEAEAVRDSLLYAGGTLDLQQGGPDIDHRQGLEVFRRSLYFRHARERQVQFLQLFDAANPRECYRRQQSIRPQQAYALVNSSLALAESRRLAQQHPSDGRQLDNLQFINWAFETLLARQPTGAELLECQRFLDQQTARLSDASELKLLGSEENPVPPATDPAQRARENLVLVLFNHNDFVTIR